MRLPRFDNDCMKPATAVKAPLTPAESAMRMGQGLMKKKSPSKKKTIATMNKNFVNADSEWLGSLDSGDDINMRLSIEAAAGNRGTAAIVGATATTTMPAGAQDRHPLRAAAANTATAQGEAPSGEHCLPEDQLVVPTMEQILKSDGGDILALALQAELLEGDPDILMLKTAPCTETEDHTTGTTT